MPKNRVNIGFDFKLATKSSVLRYSARPNNNQTSSLVAQLAVNELEEYMSQKS